MHVYVKIFAIALLCLPFAARAATGNVFMQARQLAEREITSQQQQRCLRSITARLPGHALLSPIGDFRFNTAISRGIYDIYRRNASHSIAFTVPVYLSRNRTGNVACFYALTGDGMVFHGPQLVDSWWMHQDDY